jgi:hypothetical protein
MSVEGALLGAVVDKEGRWVGVDVGPKHPACMHACMHACMRRPTSVGPQSAPCICLVVDQGVWPSSSLMCLCVGLA